VPAKTPLSIFSATFGANAAMVGRRTAVIAASSGLVVSMGVTVADAAPVTSATVPASVTVAQQPVVRSAPAAAAVKAPVAAAVPVVSVATDATVSLARATLPAAVPPPPPPPPPPPVVEERETEQASRSSERAPVAEDSEDSDSDSQETSAAPAASGAGGDIISIAKQYLGIPYVYGGTSTSGFDCSGFTQFVFGKAGISLPRTSGAQSGVGTRVSRSEAQPGDLVWKPGHIGIYAGGNMMIDSPSSGGVTSLREMWSSDFQFIRVS